MLLNGPDSISELSKNPVVSYTDFTSLSKSLVLELLGDTPLHDSTGAQMKDSHLRFSMAWYSNHSSCYRASNGLHASKNRRIGGNSALQQGLSEFSAHPQILVKTHQKLPTLHNYNNSICK